MPRNKRKYEKSAEVIACRAARAREIRDLYNKLRKTYRPAVVEKFFRDNYFIQPRTVEIFVKESDAKAVDLECASIVYITAIAENFNPLKPYETLLPVSPQQVP